MNLEISDKIKRIKYLRFSPSERFVFDLFEKIESYLDGSLYYILDGDVVAELEYHNDEYWLMISEYFLNLVFNNISDSRNVGSVTTKVFNELYNKNGRYGEIVISLANNETRLKEWRDIEIKRLLKH